ncbi:hypothetical protein B0A52_06165 [Exophiala mesophila]|uniref:Transcription factor domain-containing protein n=1 Tax=Exophiala mesophila TaxID=212818 RepID=A0A438N384_EXOME|nr:hypothetical protein B0A52_06165 [Exophiala mesophila]
MVPKRKNAVHSNFVFLSYEPNPTRTDQVLQDSQRRAHAARKSHAASRQRQRDEVMSGSNTASYSSVLLEQSVQGAESPPKVKQNLPDQITRHNERIEAGTGQYAPLLLYDLPHSLHRLAQNPIDPFNSFAAKGLPDYVYKVLYFAAETKWGNLKPSLSVEQVDQLKMAWLRANVESPTVLHAMVYGMLRSLESTHGDRTSALGYLTLKHQNCALMLLQRDLQQLGDTRPHQNLLLAIITLAAHGDLLDNGILEPSGFPESPLARTQNLHIYGLMRMVPQHRQAIFAILDQLGGIEAVTLFGLRETLEFYDLLFATRFGVPPKLPCNRPMAPLIPDIQCIPDDVAQRMLSRLGKSLFSLQELDCESIQAVEDCCILVVGLDQYQRRTPWAPSLPSLIAARTVAQHQLATLPPISDFLASAETPTAITHQIREICRIALLMFSDMTIFPVPRVSRVKARLVSTLRKRLEIISPDLWSLHRELMSWILMIGGVAARATTHRDWFVSIFHARLWWYLNEWKDVKDILETYLWWDYVYFDVGLDFWMQVHKRHDSIASSGKSLASVSGFNDDDMCDV